MQGTAKCLHCPEVPGPLSGTQSAARWLHRNPRGKLRGPLGRHNCSNAPSNPSQGISWVAHLPEHSSTCLPGSPPHRRLAGGSPSPALPGTDLCLPSLIPESCLIHATSPRNREESIRSFPQSHYPPFSFCSLLLLKVTYTWPSPCQLIGAKNAVTFLHMFQFSLCDSVDTYLMLGISVLSHVMFSAILWRTHGCWYAFSQMSKPTQMG